MYSRRKFHLTIDGAIDPLSLLTRVFADLEIAVDITISEGGTYTFHGARLCDNRVGVTAFVNVNRGMLGPDDLFEVLRIRSQSGSWVDVDISIYDHNDVLELFPLVLRIIGSVLRNSPGDLILLDDGYEHAGLVKRGDKITLNSYWQWTDSESALLGVEHNVTLLPGRPTSA